MEKTMYNISSCRIISLAGIIVLQWVIAFQTFIESLFRLYSSLRKIINERKTQSCAISTSMKPVVNEFADGTKICRKEIEMVIAEVGMLGFPEDEDEKFQEQMDVNDMSRLFEEEPSLEEVEEAFQLFDKNCDGFIDATELKKVLWALGFVKSSEFECARMIRVFDDNGDGKIDFHEFVKVVGSSLC